MESDYELKLVELGDFDAKHGGRIVRRSICPECGNELQGRISGGYVFCRRCHRMIGISPGTFHGSLKSLEDIKWME